ncbi:MAG: hypothetical protein G01um101472_474 [Parcubacteria group bacterium Gr01-1014_72]|nr:MAG: hypothetical protein G01um101472_474 [Parcubacteria group bacterium Gr01-1014_72]
MHLHKERGIAPIAALIIILLAVGGGTVAVKKIQKRKAEKEAAATAEEVRGRSETARTVHVKLDEQNMSGVRGEATLTEVGGKVKVVLTTTGKPSEMPPPAHIHTGSCPSPEGVKYPLTNVGRGASQTEIDMTLDALLAQLPLAINVHKSAAELGAYIACGNIEAKNVSGMKQEEQAGEKKSAPAEKKIEPKKESALPPAKRKMIRYTSGGFSPALLTVKRGEAVNFVNESGGGMFVASDFHPTHTAYPEFSQSATIGKGESYSFTFTKAGAWGYHNHVSPTKIGVIVVEE